MAMAIIYNNNNNSFHMVIFYLHHDFCDLSCNVLFKYDHVQFAKMYRLLLILYHFPFILWHTIKGIVILQYIMLYDVNIKYL